MGNWWPPVESNDLLITEMHRMITILESQGQERKNLENHLMEHMRDEHDDHRAFIEMAEKIAAHDVQITGLERLMWALIGAIGFMAISAVGYWIAFLMQHKEL